MRVTERGIKRGDIENGGMRKLGKKITNLEGGGGGEPKL